MRLPRRPDPWRVAALAVLALVVPISPTIAAQSPAPDDGAGEPVVELDKDRAPYGHVVEVGGSGFEPNDVVVITLCGNNALNGSVDCDVAGTRTVPTTAQGTFARAVLTLNEPPSPCPCVITVASRTGGELVTTRFQLVGVSTEIPTQGTSSSLEIADVTVHHDQSWRSWFGAGSTWVVSVTVRNDGGRAARPMLAMTVGRPENPTGFVAVPDIDVLEAGAQSIIAVPVELGPLSAGDYVVRTELVGQQALALDRQLSTHPWGIYLAAAILALLSVAAVVGAAWRRIRPRRNRVADTGTSHGSRAADSPEEAPPGSEPLSEEPDDLTDTDPEVVTTSGSETRS